MRVFLMDNNANIEVNISYNSIPSSIKYEEKNFKNNFYVYGPKDKSEVKFVGLMIISHKQMSSRFGCAFSYIKNSNKDFDVNDPKHLKNQTFDRVKVKGVDYEGLTHFPETEEDKKKRRRKMFIDPEELKKKRDIIIRNKKEVLDPKYAEIKNKEFYVKFNLEMIRIKKAKAKKDKLMREKIEEIRTRKTRHEICKEKRENMIFNLMEVLLEKSNQTAFMRLIKVIGVIQNIKQIYLNEKRRRKAVRILMIIGSLTAKFIIPLRRFKKSSDQGCLERSKM